MLDRVIQFLAAADDFEFEARRQFEAHPRSPNWADTYLQCLGDARRQRVAARELVTLASKDSREDAAARGDAGTKYSGETLSITLEQLLQLAATARSAPAGSQRMRRSAEQMRLVAALLQENNAMAQLLWWSSDLDPVTPGRPVLNFEKWEAQR